MNRYKLLDKRDGIIFELQTYNDALLQQSAWEEATGELLDLFGPCAICKHDAVVRHGPLLCWHHLENRNALLKGERS